MTIKPLPPSRINVVGALIQSGKAVLIAQRATGELAGTWEFPGGKVESGETHQEALVREITEELGITIIVGGHVGSIDFEVATKRLSLHCYWGTVVAGAPSPQEGEPESREIQSSRRRRRGKSKIDAAPS